MASQTSSGFVIPTIDVAPYLADPRSEAAAKIVAEIREACMTTGFFSMVGHGISKELQERVLGACKELFALPFEEKQTLRSPTLKNRGYELIGGQVLQPGALPDLKEGFYIGKSLSGEDAKVQKYPYFFGENIFPASVPTSKLKGPCEEYYEAVLQLAIRVLEMLARGLPYGDNVFADFVANDPICIMRLLHYPPHPTGADAKQLGAGAHTDFGAITLLLQDAAGGLEVLDHASGAFVPVAPHPDAYVVNVGDMLALWTRGVYRSNTHRVINKGAGDRYSVPFFFDGNCDVPLSPLDGSSLPGGKKAPTVVEHMLERFSTTYLDDVAGEKKAKATATTATANALPVAVET